MKRGWGGGGGVDQQGGGSGGQMEQMKAEWKIQWPGPSLFMPAAFYVAVQQPLHVPSALLHWPSGSLIMQRAVPCVNVCVSVTIHIRSLCVSVLLSFGCTRIG